MLNGIEKRNSVCSEYFNQEHVLVDVSIVMGIFHGGCQLISCPGRSKVKNHKLEGGVLKLSWECSEGHSGCWTSSKILSRQYEQVIYANSMLIAAGCFISGNNFDKLALFPKFLAFRFHLKSNIL